MKIEHLVMHPIQLEKVEVVKILAEKYNDNIDRKINIGANIEGECLTETSGVSKVELEVSNKNFKIEITTLGHFSFENDFEDNKVIEKFLETQGVRIMWSYIRENLYTISSKMVDHPIMLPTIDVIKTLEHAK